VPAIYHSVGHGTGTAGRRITSMPRCGCYCSQFTEPRVVTQNTMRQAWS